MIHSVQRKGNNGWYEAIVSVVDYSIHLRRYYRIRWRGSSEVPEYWWNDPHGFICLDATSKKELDSHGSRYDDAEFLNNLGT